jgi:hypothetical protein
MMKVIAAAAMTPAMMAALYFDIARPHASGALRAAYGEQA